MLRVEVGSDGLVNGCVGGWRMVRFVWESRADGGKAMGRDEKTATLQRQQSRIVSATDEENRRDERRRE